MYKLLLLKCVLRHVYDYIHTNQIQIDKRYLIRLSGLNILLRYVYGCAKHILKYYYCIIISK